MAAEIFKVNRFAILPLNCPVNDCPSLRGSLKPTKAEIFNVNHLAVDLLDSEEVRLRADNIRPYDVNR